MGKKQLQFTSLAAYYWPLKRPSIFIMVPAFYSDYRKDTLRMTKSMGALLVGAALTGVFAGTTATKASSGNAMDPGGAAGVPAGGAKRHKNSCKGRNSCKGQGGCGSTKGKNDCKGKGECRTDGRRMSARIKAQMSM